MIHQAVFGHLFILRAGPAPVAIRINGDAAARSKLAPHFDVPWIHHMNQIVHDDVHTVLMKITVIAEAEQVQLERLALHHFLVWYIRNIDRRKIRLTGHRTKARKFRAVELYEIITIRMLVVEHLEHIRRIIKHIFRPLVAEQGNVLQFFGSAARIPG